MNRKIAGTLLAMAALSWAEPSPTPGNPETNASDRNFDTNQPNSIPGGAQKMKDGSNRAMNKIDKGIHKGARKSKNGAHKAKVNTEKAVDDLTEPAVKP